MPTIPPLKPLCTARMEEAERAAIEFVRLCDAMTPRSRTTRASQRPTRVATASDTVIVARGDADEQLDDVLVELAERQEETRRYESMACGADARAAAAPNYQHEHWRSVAAERHQRRADRERVGVIIAAERAARILSARGVTLVDLMLAADDVARPSGWRVIDGGCA
jgi:hypothetical protein